MERSVCTSGIEKMRASSMTIADCRGRNPAVAQGSGSFAIAKVSRNSRAHGEASSFPAPSG